MKTFWMLLKREYWEHKTSLIKAPIALAGTITLFTILAMLLGVHHLNIEANAPMTPAVMMSLVRTLLLGVGTLFNLLALIVIGYYSLSALFDERKDRSILFWKSLPLSETNMVLAKLMTALVVTPVAAWAVMMLTGLVALVLASINVWMLGINPLSLWHIGTIFSAWGSLFLRLCMQSFAIFPVVAWFMLCGAYAKRSPFLYAILLPLLLVILEKLLLPFNVMSHFIGFQFDQLFIFWHSTLGHYIHQMHQGTSASAIISQGIILKGTGAAHFQTLLQNPQYGLGVGVGVGFIALAIFLRNNRYEC